MAVGLGAHVIVLDKNVDTLRRLDAQYGNRIQTVFSTRHALENWVRQADLVIGAVLIPGAAAPKLVNRQLLSDMQRGAAIVDVAIDQGGCFETSTPTTHDQPTYIVDDVVHYCVANMPGALARTATQALNNATLPFIQQLANKGTAAALSDNIHLRRGLNITHGELCCAEVGEAQNRVTITLDEALKRLK